MKISPLWIVALLVSVSSIVDLPKLAQAVASDDDTDREISIDCGVTQESQDTNGFHHEADNAEFVESGKIYNISSNHAFDNSQEQVWEQMRTLRSFPEGKRNCYTLKPKQGKHNNYLIRAYMSYGNYDDKNSIPYYHLHLGVNFWAEIKFENVSVIRRKTVVQVSPTNYIDVCLINVGKGIPFISLLELWPLSSSIYRATSNLLPLGLMTCVNLGMSEDLNFIRYADDIYGRSWFNGKMENSERFSTSEAINSDVKEYRLPNEVLRTAVKALNVSSSLYIDLKVINFTADSEHYVYLHFFDFEEHSRGQVRSMEITFTDAIHEHVTLKYQDLYTLVKRIPKGVPINRISITSTPGSGLPPMINAYEIYRALPQPNTPTHEQDVDAMRNIKHAYGNFMRISWQGDPCMPKEYRWEGVTCNYSESIPRVTSLNMSSSKLTGPIVTSFSNLMTLEALDLSNNQLTGEIPESLAELPYLKLLNLTGNKLTGSIPTALTEKSTTGLALILDGNPGLCHTGSCKTKTMTKKFIKPLVASVASVAVLAIIFYISLMLYKHKRIKKVLSSEKDGQIKSKNQGFSQAEVHRITNDFETEIGEGGFGKVYLGTLKDGSQVAVKLLSKSSQQGFNEFQSEAKLLSFIYHKNLVSLVGFYDDGDMRALIYEYMAKGNLRNLLSDKNPDILKWNERLQIALDAACGLDYLHNGCKPPIIHRDLKSSNILLSENMHAKIADFGLSKAFANDTDTHISTRPAGTFGYLDPEFHRSGNLNKKSDVYSFGIILLELMTGQRAITITSDGTCHISDWVNPKLEIGDIQAIVDPRLEGKFSTSSAWKFLEVAMSCVTPTAIQRPDISSVVIDIKQCLAMETSLENAESSSLISSTTLDTSYYSQCGSYSPPSAR